MKLISFLFVLITIAGCTKQRDTGARELYLVSPEKFFGYDPIQSSDMYSANEIGKVYEGLYEFHPLKRPYELLPNIAEALPTVSEDGLTYTVKIHKGVFFHHDEAFSSGKGRELKASDFVYSFKRMADPKNTAKAWWILVDKLKGLDEWRAKYAKAEKTNYADEIEGLKAIDDYTIQFILKTPAPQFLYSLAMAQTVAVAREVVEKYGVEFINHPVGTGAFTLKKYDQTNRVVYLKNPDYREKFYPTEGSEGDKEKGLLEDAGKRLPLVDKITVDVQVEEQPKWQNFWKGKSDLILLPKDNFGNVLSSDGKVLPEISQKNVVLHIDPMLDTTYYAFNNEMKMFKDKRVRQAINLAFDRPTANKLFYNNTATTAQSVIPPGMGGYDKDYKNPYMELNLDRAKALLKEAGYPEGKGFPVIKYETLGQAFYRQSGEYFAKCVEKIGIKVVVNQNTWPELTNKVARKQADMWGMAWGADYPDAENFLGLFFCPNKAPGSNGSNYCNPKFDELFVKARMMQESPERNALYAELNRLVGEEVPWVFNFHRTRFHLAHGWLKNFKYTEFAQYQFQYLNVDNEKKGKMMVSFK